jgi:hypothetical protein
MPIIPATGEAETEEFLVRGHTGQNQNTNKKARVWLER